LPVSSLVRCLRSVRIFSARWVRSNLASGSSGPHPSWVSVRTRIETRPFIPLIKRQSTSPALGTIRREAIHHISFKTFLRRLHLGGLRSSFITNMPSYYDEMLAVLKNNRHGKLLLQNAAGESAKILALTRPNRTGGPRWGTKSFWRRCGRGTSFGWSGRSTTTSDEDTSEGGTLSFADGSMTLPLEPWMGARARPLSKELGIRS
jgi:hypothetical protein